MIKYYVSKNGSDDNDGLSLSAAFLTLDKAATVASSITEEFTVYIDSGYYECSKFAAFPSSAKCTIRALNTNIDNIPTIAFLATFRGGLYYDFSIYDIIFTASDNFNKDEIRVLFYTTDTAAITFYNCAFTKNKTTGYPTQHFFFGHSSSGGYITNKSFFNCSFEKTSYNAVEIGVFNLTNCALSESISEKNANAIYTNCKFDSVLDDSFSLASDNTTYGVYSGDNAWTNVLCLLKVENKYYSIKSDYYDSSTKSYRELQADQYGAAKFPIGDLISSIAVEDETFIPISKFTSFKICTDKNSTIMINGLKSTSELIVGKSSFSTSFAENIDYFKLSGNKLDGIKLAISIDDGLTWKTYDSETEAFKDLDITIPTSNYSDFSSSDIENWNAAKTKISTDGIDASGLNSIDFNKLNSTKIKFAYVITAQSASEMDSMKNLAWQFDAKGLLRQCTPDEVTVEVNSNGVKVTSKIDAEILKTNILYES